MKIAGRSIGPGFPPFVVAEMSGNHGGSLEHCLRLVRAAKECGADAIKFQTYTPDTITVKSIDPRFGDEAAGPWAGRSLYELYAEAHTPWNWQSALFAEARRIGIIPFSSAFDATAVDFLETLGTPAYKVASFELNDLPLIERIALTGKPIIISTGMASETEIVAAVSAARSCESIALLKCTSDYPARPEDMNLAMIAWLREIFGCPVGLSDHTLGSTVAIAAVAMGACVVEKHLCLDRAAGNEIDGSFSMEPPEFAGMVRAIREAWQAIGQVHFGPTKSEEKNYHCRRGLFVVRAVAAGEPFTLENLRSLRPGYGLAPRFLKEVLGRKASAAIPAGTPLQWEHFL